MKKKQTTRKIWGENKIEAKPWYFGALRLKYALLALKEVKGEVLEVGSGAGAFTRAVKQSRLDLKLTGSDLDPQLVKLAKKKDAQNQYRVADLNRLPFAKNSFEALLAFDVLEHLKNPQKGFKEIARVLKKNGVFHASIPLEGDGWTLHGLFLKLGLKPKEKYAGHIQQYRGQEVFDLLKKAGFKQINFFYSGHFFYQLIDFFYFFFLSLFKKQAKHTVEGYAQVGKRGFSKSGLRVIVMFLATFCYFESFFLKRIPGQIGHITAIKR